MNTLRSIWLEFCRQLRHEHDGLYRLINNFTLWLEDPNFAEEYSKRAVAAIQAEEDIKVLDTLKSKMSSQNK